MLLIHWYHPWVYYCQGIRHLKYLVRWADNHWSPWENLFFFHPVVYSAKWQKRVPEHLLQTSFFFVLWRYRHFLAFRVRDHYRYKKTESCFLQYLLLLAFSISAQLVHPSPLWCHSKVEFLDLILCNNHDVYCHLPLVNEECETKWLKRKVFFLFENFQ